MKTPGKGSVDIKFNKRKNNNIRLIIYLALLALLVVFMIKLNSYIRNMESKRDESLSTETKKDDFRMHGVLTVLDENRNSLVVIDIEIVDDEYERQKGLMDRRFLPANAGMFFIFDEDRPRSFWMKNTPLSLDIMFINDSMKIVTIQKTTTPYSEASVPSYAPARYVLEVNAGYSDAKGIKEGYFVDVKIGQQR